MRAYISLLCLAALLLIGSEAAAQLLEAAPPRRPAGIEVLLLALERTPHAGPTFDAVLQHFAKNGGVEALVQRYKDRAEGNLQDVQAWLMLGLLEASQKHEKESSQAYDKAAEAVLVAPEQFGGLNNPGPLRELTRIYAERGNAEKLRAIYDGYLQSRRRLYTGDADNVTYIQGSDLAQVATNAAQAGDVSLLLDYLAQFADLPPTTRELPQQYLTVPLYLLAWQLQSLKPAERYQLLRDWTLPTAERRTIRFVVACSPGQQLPLSFLPASTKKWGPPPEIGVLTNLSLLVDAAKAAEELEDLVKRLQPALKEKLPHAECLDLLAGLADGTPVVRTKVQKYQTTAIKRIKNPPPADQRRTSAAMDTHWEDIQILFAALADAKLRDSAHQFGEHVLNDNRRTFPAERMNHTGRILALAGAADLPREEQTALLSPGLKHWTPGTPAGMTTNASPPAWWSAADDQITHLTGFDYDCLFFNYPLTGTFEFSLQAHSYDFSQSEVAYGGLIAIPEYWNARVQILPASRHETVTRGGTVEAKGWWNTYSVRVSPEAIRFYSNGHLLYSEEEPSPTSPWLHLVALDHRRTTMRRLEITGKPEIPREVKLVAGDRLEGWSNQQFYEKLDYRLTLREPPAMSPDGAPLPRPIDNRPADWYAADGLLHGRLDGSAYQPQARLQYHRPLRGGEELTYEFFYEPEKVQVHPALGRLAFLLEPKGLRLQWLTNGFTAGDPFGLINDNAIDEPAIRRGPEALPLTAGNWNQVALALKDNAVQLKLNGKLVCERTMEANNDLRFGFYHDRNRTAAQVRNVLLRGDWPKELDAKILNNLLEPAASESPALARARHAAAREEELSDDAYGVWRHAMSLKPQQRYEYLRTWVLPSESRPTVRLQADFTPVDPPLPVAREAIAKLKGERQHTGGEMVSPAIELVRTAAEIKKLEALEADAKSFIRQSREGARNLLALQTLIAMERNEDKLALANLHLLLQQLHDLDPTTTVVDRYPEFTTVVAASDRATLRGTAGILAELLVENQQSNYQTNDWERRVRWLRAKLRWLNDPLTAKQPMSQPTPPASQWHVVSHPTAEMRGKGYPAATWQVAKGKAEFYTGHGTDSLYFQSPLTGDFEMSCRRTTYGWKEIRLLYGALAFDVNHDGVSLWRVPLQRGWTQIPFDAKAAKWGERCDFKFAMQDGDLTVSVNGKPVYTETLGEHPDPWLAIQTHASHYNGSVENLRITGSPVIPESVLITATPDLSPWRSDYYGDSIDAETALWTRRGHEIIGNLHRNAPGSYRESVLHYHRPLLEDGEIEYEFYYEAGKTEVYPALDRAAFLLSPSGVRVHYLTDGAYERNGLSPDNAEPLKDSAKELALRENAWNHVKLAIKGDVATLLLNGKQIGTYEIEPTNQRLFGLFRYSDATECRVRIVKHRGDWPKKLPPVKEQFLAVP